MRPVTNARENSSVESPSLYDGRDRVKVGRFVIFSSDDVTSHSCRHLHEENRSSVISLEESLRVREFKILRTCENIKNLELLIKILYVCHKFCDKFSLEMKITFKY